MKPVRLIVLLFCASVVGFFVGHYSQRSESNELQAIADRILLLANENKAEGYPVFLDVTSTVTEVSQGADLGYYVLALHDRLTWFSSKIEDDRALITLVARMDGISTASVFGPVGATLTLRLEQTKEMTKLLNAEYAESLL